MSTPRIAAARAEIGSWADTSPILRNLSFPTSDLDDLTLAWLTALWGPADLALELADAHVEAVANEDIPEEPGEGHTYASTRAVALATMGIELDEAISLASEQIRQFPEDRTARLALGLALLKSDRVPEGHEQLDWLAQQESDYDPQDLMIVAPIFHNAARANRLLAYRRLQTGASYEEVAGLCEKAIKYAASDPLFLGPLNAKVVPPELLGEEAHLAANVWGMAAYGHYVEFQRTDDSIAALRALEEQIPVPSAGVLFGLAQLYADLARRTGSPQATSSAYEYVAKTRATDEIKDEVLDSVLASLPRTP